MMGPWIQQLLDAGMRDARLIDQSAIVYDRAFREICATNACGYYGACHMCPPDAGNIDALIARAKQYPQGWLYQTVFSIEDSFDIEGMLEARKAHTARSQRLQTQACQRFGDVLHLSVGGCGVCARCARRDNLPCRFPERAMGSLEAYGIDVYRTAANAGLPYTNGENTITYFGLILFR